MFKGSGHKLARILEPLGKERERLRTKFREMGRVEGLVWKVTVQLWGFK